MKSSILSLLPIVASFGTAIAKELPPNEATAEIYRSGSVHESIIAKKLATWDQLEAQGLMDSARYPSRSPTDGPVACENGIAEVIPGDRNNTFTCNNVDFYDFQSHVDLGSNAGRGSSSWGWTSEDGREFVAVGQEDGTAFAEISKEGKLVYLGRLPQYSVPSLWREIKGYKSYAIIGSEAVGHGVQIFDFKKLLDLDPASPVTFTQADLTSHFNELPAGRAHNVVVNEESQFAVAVGSQPRNSTCKSGLIFIDLTDVENPYSPGCAPDDGYVHDAQCLVYRGPDTQYVGRDVCYGYNEDTLTIYDVTDKNASVVISRTSYEGASYTHQGWVLDQDWQQYLVLDDEYDEEDGAGPGADGFATTFFWDISSLAAPKQTGYYKSSTKSIDHNQFVINGYTYQSNYGAGLRILDISSIPQDPTGASVSEVGFFDIYPEDDDAPDGGRVAFVGTWSHYPYFKSGYILINTIERGAFVVKLRK